MSGLLDGGRAGLSWEGGTPRRVDLATGRAKLLLGKAGGDLGGSVSPDGRLSATTRENGIVVFRTHPGGLPLLVLEAEGPVAWSPDGKWLASAGDGSAVLWDADSLRLRGVLPAWGFSAISRGRPSTPSPAALSPIA